MPKIKTIQRGDGSKRYRFVIDVAPKDAAGKPIGPRNQETHTYDSLAEAESGLAGITRELELGTYVHRRNRRTLARRAPIAGKVLCEDLFRSGQCTPNCMHGWSERSFRYNGCVCPCGGKWHGALAHVVVPADGAGVAVVRSA